MNIPSSPRAASFALPLSISVLANYKKFVAVTEQIVQVNEAICEAR